MTDLYSHIETEERKRDLGMALAADANATPLAWLREAIRAKAIDLRKRGVRDYVSADDARILLEMGIALGIERPRNNNFLGSLFSGKDWEFTGYRIKSTTPGSHANELKCWRWIGA